MATLTPYRAMLALALLGTCGAATAADSNEGHAAAPVFSELAVDDFFCTADVGEESKAARGCRSWSDYRRRPGSTRSRALPRHDLRRLATESVRNAG